MPRRNRTHLSRAARKLTEVSELSYQQALEVLRNLPAVPPLDRFNDPEYVATLVAAPAGSPQPGFVLDEHYRVTINDELGHTEDVWISAALFPEMVDAITADPGAGRWTGETWTVTNMTESFSLDVVWSDEGFGFVLSDGSLGNPGCDHCGSADAVARVNGTYLCGEALPADLVERCDECDHLVRVDTMMSSMHGRYCSLNSSNEVKPAPDPDVERARELIAAVAPAEVVAFFPTKSTRWVLEVLVDGVPLHVDEVGSGQEYETVIRRADQPVLDSFAGLDPEDLPDDLYDNLVWVRGDLASLLREVGTRAFPDLFAAALSS